MSLELVKIETVALSELVPNPNNAKIHTDEQIEQIRASIRKFGFRDPIGVDDNNVIVEGHGRVRAALAEGITHVPAIRLSHLDTRQRDAYMVAHNRLQQLSGLDISVMRDDLSGLDLSDDDFFAMGFDKDDVLFLDLGGDSEINDFTGGEINYDTEGRDDSETWNTLVSPVIKSILLFSNSDQLHRFHVLVNQIAQSIDGDRRLPSVLLHASRVYSHVG
jgi:hypothetical protein